MRQPSIFTSAVLTYCVLPAYGPTYIHRPAWPAPPLQAHHTTPQKEKRSEHHPYLSQSSPIEWTSPSIAGTTRRPEPHRPARLLLQSFETDLKRDRRPPTDGTSIHPPNSRRYERVTLSLRQDPHRSTVTYCIHPRWTNHPHHPLVLLQTCKVRTDHG